MSRLQQTADQRLVGFLLAMVPLTMAHLVIPPISYLKQEEMCPSIMLERLYHLTTSYDPRLTSFKYVMNMLTYDEESVAEKGELYRGFSHLWVHVSYEHLFNNLLSAYNVGYPVYAEYGAVGMYTVFILGGMSAVVPTIFHEVQHKNLERDINNLTSFIPGPEIIDRDSKLGRLKSKAASVGKNICVTSSLILFLFVSSPLFFFNFYHEVADVVRDSFLPTSSCGSSGAVYALVGASLVIIGRRLYRIVSDKFSVHNNANRYPSVQYHRNTVSQNQYIGYSGFSLREFRKKCIDVISDDRFGNILYSAGSIGFFLLKEMDMLFNDPVNALSPIKIIEYHRVGHATHVQGAIFGVLWALYFGRPNVLPFLSSD